MLQDRIAPLVRPAEAPLSQPLKPFFDESARLNPMMRPEALRAATPMFEHEVRKIDWLHQDRSARRGAWLRGLRKQTRYFLILWAATFFFSSGADLLSGQSTSLSLVGGILIALVAALLMNVVLTFLSTVLLDVACVGLRIRRDGEWDLIRLTPLSRRGIVVSIFAFARFFYRSTVVGIFNERLFSLYGLLLLAISSVYLLTRFVGMDVAYAFDALFDGHPAQGYVILLIVLSSALILLCETRWRTNGMAALGAALAFWVSGHPLSLVARVGALLAAWLGQFAAAALSWWVSDAIVDWLRRRQLENRLFADRGYGIDPVTLQILFAVLIFGVLLYVYFRLMRFASLRVAYQGILRRE
ncbi:MAG: hypothetical protein U0521_15875 [Anaerolineae bacterium]